MDQAITFTPKDLVDFFLALCGALVSIVAAYAAILKIRDYFKKPNKTQDEKIKALEKEVEDIKARLDDGSKRFADDTRRIDRIEKEMNESNKIIIISLQALTAHAIDGGDKDKLVEAKRSLDGYLLDQLGKGGKE